MKIFALTVQVLWLQRTSEKIAQKSRFKFFQAFSLLRQPDRPLQRWFFPAFIADAPDNYINHHLLPFLLRL